LRARNLRLRREASTRPSGGGGGSTTGWGAGNRATTRGSYPKTWMRGPIRANVRRRGRLKFLRGSKSWKEGDEFPLPLPMTFPAGMGREAASFTTTPRAAMTMRRRTADSAGRSTARTALCRERGIREAASVPSSPSRAKSTSMIPLSALLLRLMAKFQSMVFPCKEHNRNTNGMLGI
jgi:hypothetical protein